MSADQAYKTTRSVVNSLPVIYRALAEVLAEDGILQISEDLKKQEDAKVSA